MQPMPCKIQTTLFSNMAVVHCNICRFMKKATTRNHEEGMLRYNCETKTFPSVSCVHIQETIGEIVVPCNCVNVNRLQLVAKCGKHKRCLPGMVPTDKWKDAPESSIYTTCFGCSDFEVKYGS